MRQAIQRHSARVVELTRADVDRAVGVLCIVILAALPLLLNLEGGAL